MAFQLSEPLCSTRLGPDWIDGGTLSRTRNQSSVLGKQEFDRGHVYSLSREAAKKRGLDLKIIGDDYNRGTEVSLDNEAYLKKLIKLGSRGRKKVLKKAAGLQFFIIHGGGEGFLQINDRRNLNFATENAGDVGIPGETTSHHATTFRFDENDLMAVFDQSGNLISAALLERPIEIPKDPKKVGNKIIKRFVWSRGTANMVYNAWDNKAVHIYRNTYWFDRGGIKYLGLTVDDGFRPNITVDIHKQEATNGCIFIVDPKCPGMEDKDALDAFEPKLIIDVLAAKGMKPETVTRAIRLGTMHVIDIR